MNLENKKAAEMTIGTIIVIVLALVVLVFLIFAFASGNSNLMEQINNFFGGGSNVQSIVTSCQAACSTNQVYEYCRIRDVRFEKGKTPEKLNCKALEGKSVGLEICNAISVCASCSGEANPCAGIVAESCTNQAGCSLKDNECSGTPKACSELSDSTSCIKQTGCTWA
jgi:hypothetical protein